MRRLKALTFGRCFSWDFFLPLQKDPVLGLDERKFLSSALESLLLLSLAEVGLLVWALFCICGAEPSVR